MLNEQILGNDQILILLEQQIDNFPELKKYIQTKGIKPSNIFLPQTLKSISEEIDNRSYLVLEALDYLDIVKFYSILVYNDPELFITNVISIIVENRIVNNINNSINKAAIDDFIFASKEEAFEFLINNKFLVALYLFSLVVLIFYKSS